MDNELQALETEVKALQQPPIEEENERRALYQQRHNDLMEKVELAQKEFNQGMSTYKIEEGYITVQGERIKIDNLQRVEDLTRSYAGNINKIQNRIEEYTHLSQHLKNRNQNYKDMQETINEHIKNLHSIEIEYQDMLNMIKRNNCK